MLSRITTTRVNNAYAPAPESRLVDVLFPALSPQVAITFHGKPINSGDLPLMSAVSSNATLMQVAVAETVKGSAPFVNEVQRITMISNGTDLPAGTFRVLAGRNKTTPLAFDIDESDLALALEQLPSIRSSIDVSSSTSGDSSSWTVTFTSPGPQRLLASPCEEAADGNGTPTECLLGNASLQIRRVVRGGLPASGTFRLRLVTADGSPGSAIAVDASTTTAPLPLDATAAEVQAAVVGLVGGRDATVTVASNARAEYGFEWGLSLHDSGTSSVELTDVNIDVPGSWCADGVTGSAAAETPCEFPFTVGEDGNDVHFTCAGAVGSNRGWCSTAPTFNQSKDWGGCVRCAEGVLAGSPTIHVASLRRMFRLKGRVAQVSQALSETVYHPRAFWNAWLGGHDEVSAYWYDEDSSEGSERLSGARARSFSQVFVAPINDPPSVTVGGETRVGYEAQELLLDDADVFDPDLADRPQIPVRVEIEAKLGTLALRDTSGLTFMSGSPESHSSQRLVVKGSLLAIRNALQQVYYRPLSVSTASAVAPLVNTTLEVQRVELTAPLVPMVQSITTSTPKGYIEGNFTLSLNCSAFFKEVDDFIAGETDFFNQTVFNSSASVVQSPPLMADAPATGQESIETELRALLAGCVDLAWDRVSRWVERSNETFLGNSSLARNFTEDMLPHRGATAIVSRGEPNLQGSLTWAATLIDVPQFFPAFEVGSNNLTAAGEGLDGSPYAFNKYSNLSGTPSISIDVVKAASPLSGLNGTFSLAVTPGGEMTDPIPASASGDYVAAALMSLEGVGAVQVSTGPVMTSLPATAVLGQYWEITFLQSGSPVQVGDLPLLEVTTVGFGGEEAVLHVSEVVKGRSLSDSVTIVVNDLGNVGEGGALEASAAWNIAIIPKDVAPVVRQLADGMDIPGDLLRTVEGNVLPLPSVLVSHSSAFEVAGHNASNVLQYLVRVTCSRGTAKPTSSAVGQALAVTLSSATVTLLNGKLSDINRALANLRYHAPRRYRGVDDVEVAARVAGLGASGGWGTTKMYVFVDGINDPPKLSAPRSFTAKGAVPIIVGGISVGDDDTMGIITVTVDAARGVVFLPDPHRLQLFERSAEVKDESKTFKF